MSRPYRSSRSSTSGAKTRAELADRLRARRLEIEDAFLTRASAIGAPRDIDDAEYQEGFRRAVSAAFDFTVSIVETEGEIPPIPITLLSQARLAARNSVGLDIILRRYVAGSSLLDSFVVREVDQREWTRGRAWERLTYDRSTALDSLIATISEEHRREVACLASRKSDQTLKRVKGILSGLPSEALDSDYSFDANHVGLIAEGSATEALHQLAYDLDCRPLIVKEEKGLTWAWFGFRREIGWDFLKNPIARALPAGVSLGVGEQGKGVAGWRLSHRQAGAAFEVARQGHAGIARYGDVCILASSLQDDLLRASLHTLFLKPLESESDGGKALRSTLHAYFASGRNGASAAHALGVSRQTVASRLRAAERHLGRSIAGIAVEIETALHVHEFLSSSSDA